MKKGSIFLIAAIICLVLFAVVWHIASHTAPKKIVDCYDEYENKIIGAECETADVGVPISLFALAIVLLMFLFFILAIIHIGDGD